MTLIERLHKPTHVLMPIGAKTTMTPEMAAQVCHSYLKSCRVLIPMLFRSTSDTEEE